jgi:mannose-6-phosphate isomerase
VGEVWLTSDDNRVTNGVWEGRTIRELCRASGREFLGRQTRRGEPPGFPCFPLLVKFIFTSDKLSVQVHPSDHYARETEGTAGKTEMWHVLKAQPGARLAIGFREELTDGRNFDREALRKAVENGAIEEMLNWIAVKDGDTFFVPSGTVHAIGAGLILCEIQQNSDVTYRLYDYNRPGTDGLPRPLHLEKALDVIERHTSGGRTEPLKYADQGATRLCLAACPYFATEKVILNNSAHFATDGRFEIWICVEGEAEFEAAGERTICRRGEVVILPAQARSFSVRPASPCTCIRSYEPELERDVLAPLRALGYSDQQLSRVCFTSLPISSSNAV